MQIMKAEMEELLEIIFVFWRGRGSCIFLEAINIAKAN